MFNYNKMLQTKVLHKWRYTCSVQMVTLFIIRNLLNLFVYLNSEQQQVLLECIKVGALNIVCHDYLQSPNNEKIAIR